MEKLRAYVGANVFKGVSIEIAVNLKLVCMQAFM